MNNWNILPVEGGVMNDDIIGYKETAGELGSPVGTVYSFVARKLIPHFRLGPRNVKFSRSAIREWIQQRAVSTEPSKKSHNK